MISACVAVAYHPGGSASDRSSAAGTRTTKALPLPAPRAGSLDAAAVMLGDHSHTCKSDAEPLCELPIDLQESGLAA
jgi:hypothetical protein